MSLHSCDSFGTVLTKTLLRFGLSSLRPLSASTVPKDATKPTSRGPTLVSLRGNAFHSNRNVLPTTGPAPRLLRTGTYELVEPDKVDIGSGKYAILSHTWRLERDEITFRDMSPERLQSSTTKEAFKKIRLTCEQATRDGLDHVWIDTCCIDKSSSADLSEAINSMYAWYARAKVCYVYMSDVDIADGEEAFRGSRWFTRAWTLQELIAPREVRFYDVRWRFMGRLSHPRCAKVVSGVTGIDINMLLGKSELSDFSIAQRMSWAAHRHATRIEDRAYSLLGIFGVNMSMIYGESDKAFTRLQEHIIRTTTDHSIFCWNSAPGEDIQSGSRSLFAPSPSHFADSKDVVQRSTRSPRPFNMTNRGLEITLPVHMYMNMHRGIGYTQAKLDCTYQGEEFHTICLKLQRQYDLDADKSDGFEPWASRWRRARQEAWDYLMGRTFDWHFVASHARRAFAVGHDSQGARIEKCKDDAANYREQTIVILREGLDLELVDPAEPLTTANPLANFLEVIVLCLVLGAPILVVFVISISFFANAAMLRFRQWLAQETLLERILVRTEQAMDEQLLKRLERMSTDDSEEP